MNLRKNIIEKKRKGIEQGIWLMMVIVLCLVIALTLITIFRSGTKEAGNQTSQGIDQSAGGVYDVLEICGCVGGVCTASCNCQLKSSCPSSPPCSSSSDCTRS
ncbi:MAG: hypothetical protein K0B02_04910 [DPANN group archaeon]|nr:hypothetical protein [DPANN group archaeon]